MSKTRQDLATAVLEELHVKIGGAPAEAEDSAVILAKIDEVMPEVERKGVVTDWRGDAIDELYMDALAKLVAARTCRKFVTDGEITSYEALEPRAWRQLSQAKSEPYQSRPVRASHI